MSDLKIFELRDYTLHPGRRDELIELFEREFVHTQEAVGIRVLGTFRDLERPDHFVWMRGFPSMEARAVSLEAFYGGPVWKRHREAANATMIDSDNVLLLQPAWNGAAEGVVNPAKLPGPRMQLRIESFPSGEALEKHVGGMERSGVALKTEPSPNTFPRLPVREREWVFVQMLQPGEHRNPAQALSLFLEPTAGSKLR